MSDEPAHRVMQPYLQDLVTAVRAPTVLLCRPDASIRDGADGLYCRDHRVLSGFVLTVDGRAPAPVSSAALAADTVEFRAVVRDLGDAGADPTVMVHEVRTVRADGMTETVTVQSHAREPVSGMLELTVNVDFAEMADVKAGRETTCAAPEPRGDGLAWSGPGDTHVALRSDPPPDVVEESGVLRWPVFLGPGERATVALHLDVETSPRRPTVLASSITLDAGPRVSGLRRWDALLRRGVRDIDALLLADPLAPDDHFVAAGAPWYLTLFGRDSIWAARMLLPVSTELAAGTLRTLARRQGTVADVERAEQPGKIMHEVRDAATVHAGHQPQARMRLPSLYYGTVDATPLWVSLLHDAWRWGLDADATAALLPNAERAMRWLSDYGMDEAGFVSYQDTSGQGLRNQGWKDSGDSVQFSDGTLAAAPLALCEVQGYAHQAALQYASLLDAFGRTGAQSWRDWAARLAQRFREQFWVDDEHGRYPAIALEASGRRVDTVTSNIAHLLNTGLLDDAEQALVVDRLRTTAMDSGYGLRTTSGDALGYNPLAYHGGSVWTHDTAIAVAGVAGVSGPSAAELAASLAGGVLRAGRDFGYRMPELYAGFSTEQTPAAVPYPAACRPQAWSAASAVSMLVAVLGLQPDVPAGTIRVAPLRPWSFGALTVHNLRVAGESFDVQVQADGTATVANPPAGLQVVTG